MLTLTNRIDMRPGAVPLVIHLGQYDSDFSLVFELYSSAGNFTVESGTTAMIRGTKTDGNAYDADATINISAKTVTVAGSEQMTAAKGRNVYELVLKKGTKVLSTANFILDVERAAMDADTIASESVLKELNAIIAGAETATEAAQTATAAAESVSGSTAQIATNTANIATNTADISDLKEDLSQLDEQVGVIVEQEIAPINATLLKKVNQPLNGSSQPVHGTNGQVLRTKGDGSTEWATVGQPTDAQTAQAVSDWLDAHPDATTSVEDGSISRAKLSPEVSNLLTNIVNVKDYGAINNDGVIDSAAVQACIDANPHATIFFPKGTYTIDTPIKCYSQIGGTFLFLGGVTIQARASMPYMFYFHNYSDSGVTRGGVGPFGIFGGVLDANGMAEECVRSTDAWVLRLTDVLCINFTVCGIRATGGGLHHYTRVKCDIEQRFPWSEGTTTGIIADQVDSFFTDIQIMSCKYAVKIGGGGHIFSGCYFMSRINYHLDDTLHWQGIGVYIENKDVTPLVAFNNCYFDSHIYTFWSDSSKVWDLDVNNCRFYYTHETQFDAEQAYILGGNNINIRARGCAIFSRPNCDTLLGRMSYSATNNKNFIFEQNKPLDTYIGNVLNVANMGGGLLEFGKDVKKDDLFWVGAISNANLKGGTYKMTIGYGDNYTELIFKNDGATNKFTLVDAKYGFKLAFFSVFIGQVPKTATGTIETVTYYPIYLYANIAFRGQVKINLEPLSFKPACCYIFNNGWRDPGGPVDDPFIMQLIDTSEPIEETSGDFNISSLANGEYVKLGNVVAKTANGVFKLELGFGGSYAEFVVRKVGNTYSLWKGDRYFNTNFFSLVIDTTPVTSDDRTLYPIYLLSRVSNLGGVLRIICTPMTPLTTIDFFDEYETGTFTVSSPFDIPMKV